MVGALIQTTFAAVSFVGAGYLFKFFDHNGYTAEMKGQFSYGTTC